MSAPSNLQPVADLYPEISGKYQVANTESGISSIEMMGNGHYLLRKAPTYYSKKMNAAKKEALTKGIYHDTSIETEDLIYGCFTKLSDMQYELDGFGTFQVARRDAQNVVVDIVLTDYTGTSIELNVNLEETVGELMTGNTALLCGRFWQLVKDQCTVWVNDKLGFNGIYYAEEDRVSVLVNDIMASPDYFFDFGDETTTRSALESLGRTIDSAKSALLSDASYDGFVDFLKTQINDFTADFGDMNDVVDNLSEVTSWENELRSLAPLYTEVIKLSNDEEFSFREYVAMRSIFE